MPDVKCLVVGDAASKRTEVLCAYRTGKTASDQTDSIDTVSPEHSVTQIVGGDPYTLYLHDTNPSEEHHESRPIAYQNTDIFLVFFSVISPSTVKSVEEKWVSEIRQHCPHVPFLLVGTEIDLRELPEVVESLAKDDERPVTRAHGKQLARKVGAVEYLECSANTLDGVKEVFHEALLTGLKPDDSEKAKKSCLLM